MSQSVPSYLASVADRYAEDPRGAALSWLLQSRYGLFMHYGPYSLLGRGEWVQYHEAIHVDEYEKLAERFTAEKFDAEAICDVAVEAGMHYVNITTRHHDSFCLWDTAATDFNSMTSPARRDLVAELAEACRSRGLGLCLYYSHGRDWRHPHAPNNDLYGPTARPQYDRPEPRYARGDEHDLSKYIDFMHTQLEELLTGYGPIASIWFDGWGTPAKGDLAPFRLEETYALIRRLQPQCLISYKWGFTDTEDYIAPEYPWLENNPQKTREMIDSGKPIEVCAHLAGWGWWKEKDGTHPGPDHVMQCLDYTGSYGANLLLNLAPRDDGSLDPVDVETVREVGRRLSEASVG